MVISENRIFVYNPFDVLKVLVPAMILLSFAVAFFTYSSLSASRKALNGSFTGILFLILGISFGVVLLTSLFLSFINKRTIVCASDGFEIYAVNAWGKNAPTERFRWNELTDTSLHLVNVGKSGTQLDLYVSINEKEVYLLTHNFLNKQKFGELIEIINQSTLHLPHELIETKNAGKRQIIEEVRNFCKVARI